MLTDDRLDHLCVGALHAELAPGALEDGAQGLLVSEIIDDFTHDSNFMDAGPLLPPSMLLCAVLPSSRPPSDTASSKFECLLSFVALLHCQLTESLGALAGLPDEKQGPFEVPSSYSTSPPKEGMIASPCNTGLNGML